MSITRHWRTVDEDRCVLGVSNPPTILTKYPGGSVCDASCVQPGGMLLPDQEVSLETGATNHTRKTTCGMIASALRSWLTASGSNPRGTTPLNMQDRSRETDRAR